MGPRGVERSQRRGCPEEGEDGGWEEEEEGEEEDWEEGERGEMDETGVRVCRWREEEGKEEREAFASL